MNRLKKAILFVLIFCCLFISVQYLLMSSTENWMRLRGFYNEPVNSIDIVFFGASHCHHSINPHILWSEAGVPSYVLSQPGQPLWMTYYYMIEVLKYQKPKIMFLETRYAYVLNGQNYDIETDNESAYWSLDAMKMSSNKLRAAVASLRAQDILLSILPVMRYHTEWRPLVKSVYNLLISGRMNSVLNNAILNKGYVYADEIKPFENIKIQNTDKIGKIKGKNLEYLNKIINLSKQEGFSLVFFKAPYPEALSDLEDQKIDNKLQEIAGENELVFLNLNNRIDDIGVEWKTDLYDHDHLNVYGADKVSAYIAKHIKDNFSKYTLEDRRSNCQYQRWNHSSENFFETLKNNIN